jgi:hypothetical protein
MVRSLTCLALLVVTTGAHAELTTAQLAGAAAPPAETFILTSGGKRFLVSHPQEEIRVELISAEAKLTMLLSAKPPVAETAPILDVDAAKLPKLGGAAIWQNQLVCCLTRESALLFIDLKAARITSRQSLPDFTAPRAAAYDPTGRLWMFSGNSLTEIAITSDGHFNPIHHEGNFDQPEHLAITAEGKFYVAEHGAQPRLRILSAERKPLQRFEFTNGDWCAAITMDGAEPCVWLNSGRRFVVPK